MIYKITELKEKLQNNSVTMPCWIFVCSEWYHAVSLMMIDNDLIIIYNNDLTEIHEDERRHITFEDLNFYEYVVISKNRDEGETIHAQQSTNLEYQLLENKITSHLDTLKEMLEGIPYEVIRNVRVHSEKINLISDLCQPNESPISKAYEYLNAAVKAWKSNGVILIIDEKEVFVNFDQICSISKNLRTYTITLSGGGILEVKRTKNNYPSLYILAYYFSF